MILVQSLVEFQALQTQADQAAIVIGWSAVTQTPKAHLFYFFSNTVDVNFSVVIDTKNK